MKYMALLLLGVSLTACGGGDHTKADCLYAAVTVYPQWNTANGPVLENVKECKSLSSDDRLHLRDMMTAFVTKANTPKKGK